MLRRLMINGGGGGQYIGVPYGIWKGEEIQIPYSSKILVITNATFTVRNVTKNWPEMIVSNLNKGCDIIQKSTIGISIEPQMLMCLYAKNDSGYHSWNLYNGGEGYFPSFMSQSNMLMQLKTGTVIKAETAYLELENGKRIEFLDWAEANNINLNFYN